MRPGPLDWWVLSGWVPAVLLALGAVALAALVLRPGRRRRRRNPRWPGRRWLDRRWLRRTVPLAVLAAATVTAVLAALDLWRRPFIDPVPPAVLGWVAVAVLGVLLAGLRARSASARTRVAAVLAAFLVVLAAASGVNSYFGQFPTLRAALGLPSPHQVDPARVPGTVAVVPLPRWRPPPDLPANGVVMQRPIPATESAFPARPGWVYLPPAYLVWPRPLLPVLVLLAGQPGTPHDWLDGGQLAGQLDEFAAGHAGLAPVVVMPDDLGATMANPLCLDSRLGRSATYLTSDVPRWIRANLQVNDDPQAWAIGGFSHGGTCALQLAVNAPRVYPTFLDISGEQAPSLGSPAKTVQAAFGGDVAAFHRVNPLDVLAGTRFSGSAGMFIAGSADGVYRPQQERVAHACQHAGMQVVYLVLPGNHTWSVWRPGLGAALPWLAGRLGLTSQ